MDIYHVLIAKPRPSNQYSRDAFDGEQCTTYAHAVILQRLTNDYHWYVRLGDEE